MKNLKRLLRARKIKAKNRFNSTKQHSVLVFKSSKHIYAHLIDKGKVLTTVSTCTPSIKAMDKVDRLNGISELICKKAKELNVEKAYFNRNGFKYHGAVKEICENCRKLSLIN